METNNKGFLIIFYTNPNRRCLYNNKKIINLQKWFYSVELTLIKQTIPKFKVLVYFSLFSYELIWYNLIYM